MTGGTRWFLLTWRAAPGLLRGVLGVGSLWNPVFLVGMALILFRVDPWRFVYGLPPIALVTTGLALLLPSVKLARPWAGPEEPLDHDAGGAAS